MPLPRRYRSGTATAADTNAHALPSVAGILAVLRAPSGNAGTVTVLGISEDTGAADSAGIILAAGDPPLTLEITNLAFLAFKLSSANDVLEYLVGQP